MRFSVRHGVIVLALGALLTGCGWLQSGYDAGRSNGNEFENTITAANVAQLVDHSLPAPDPTDPIGAYITANGRLFMANGANVYAFSASSCPRSDDGPCQIMWKRPMFSGGGIASDGQTLFVATTAGLDALTLDGQVKWQWTGRTFGTLPPAFGGVASGTVALGGGFVHVDTVAHQDGSPGTPGRDNRTTLRLPVGGCGSPTCVAGYDPIIVSMYGITGPNVGPATFAGVSYLGTRIRHGIAVTTTGTYDLNDPACVAAITYAANNCTPSKLFTNAPSIVALSTNSVFAIDAVTSRLIWYAGVDRPCPGTPARCARLAIAPATGNYVSVGGDVVYVTSGTGLDAYAENGSTNCAKGPPRICSPLAHFALTGGGVAEIEVVDRRVYVPTVDRRLHALGLPGEVH